MAGVGNLDRGSYSGRETKVYYDSVIGSYSDPPTEDAAWVEIKRARNVTFEEGPELTDVEMHGNATNGAIPGYSSHSGSFEYVLKRGTDTVFAYLETKQRARAAVYLRFMDDDNATVGATGREGPYFLGRFEETRNGNDPVVVTIPFSHADVFNYNGVQVDRADVTISA